MSRLGKFREILYIEDTPHRLALSFAVGIGIGTSPPLGLHTIMGVAACFLYRFNRFPLFAGIFVTNPWTIIPIYSFALWLGAVVMGVDLGAVNVDWKAITFATLLDDLRVVIAPYFVGTTLVSLASSVISYLALRAAVVRAQASRHETGPIKATDVTEGR